MNILLGDFNAFSGFSIEILMNISEFNEKKKKAFTIQSTSAS